jgi:aminopeptidase YwaD
MAWEPVLETVLDTVYQPLKGEGIRWCILGSVASALQGCQVQPGDVDFLAFEPAGVYRFVELLADYMPSRCEEPVGAERWCSSVENPVSVGPDPYGFVWHFARWFIDGFKVEIAHIAAPEGFPTSRDGAGIWEAGSEGWPHLRRVPFAGYSLPVMPLEVQLQTNLERGLADRAGEIVAILARRGYDADLLQRSLSRAHGEMFARLLRQEVQGGLLRHLEHLCTEVGPRPVGSPANHAAATYVQKAFEDLDLWVEVQAFPCPLWEEAETLLEVNGDRLAVMANPWSPSCDVRAPAVALGTLAELQAAELAGRIGILYGDLTKGHGFGARSAFYFPEEHREVVRLLEEKRPAALIFASALLGSAERLMRDWQFAVPSVTVAPEVGLKLLQRGGESLHLRIEGRSSPSHFANVVAQKSDSGPDRILLLAHLDTQAGTPGACDNASGVTVLLALAERFAARELPVGLEWLIVNGEECGGLGDAEYLRRRSDTLGDVLVAINVDGVGSYVGTNSLAVMGASPALEETVWTLKAKYPGVVRVEPWYESDHTAFFFQGVPCIALTSAGMVNNNHLPGDTQEWISPARLEEAVCLIADMVEGLQERSPAWCRLG